jgi:hypothetical protein
MSADRPHLRRLPRYGWAVEEEDGTLVAVRPDRGSEIVVPGTILGTREGAHRLGVRPPNFVRHWASRPDFGGMETQVVAEQGLAHENGLVIASVFDLAGTQAKALLDRSEWKDYVDLATLLRDGHRLVDIVGYATTIFEPVFAFPAAVFLRSLVYFEDGTAPDVPAEMQRELEAVVERAWGETIPIVEPYATRIAP